MNAKKLLEEAIGPVSEMTRLMLVGGGTTAEILAAAQRLDAWLTKARAALEPKTKKAKHSERGYAFADWFRTTLGDGVRLPGSWREQWAQCFDLMLLLDDRTPEQIAAVCQWARRHDFWRANFQTPLKLRQRKDGVMYFDRFAEAMKQAGKPRAGARQSAGYDLAPEAKKKVWNPMTDA